MLVLSIVFIFPQFLFAYMDPGSLSAIWQFLAAILIGLVTAFSFVRIKIKQFYQNFFGKKVKKQFSDNQQENETKSD